MNQLCVIGISGKAGVGKDYVVDNFLLPQITAGRRYLTMSFADHFKIEAIVKDGLDRTKVFGIKDGPTREALQRRGTEEGRNKFGPDIWVNILRERILQEHSRGIQLFVITDVRFPNEQKFIEQEMKGIVIRVNAPDRNLARVKFEAGSGASHISETALDQVTFAFQLDNSIPNSPNVPALVKVIAGQIMAHHGL